MASKTNAPIFRWLFTRKALIIAGAVIILLALISFGFLYLNPAYAEDPLATSFIKDNLNRQQTAEQSLRSVYQAGKFTFTAPLVIQDPYQVAPLTALAIFDTPEAGQISVHVPGIDPASTVDFTFPGYQTHHEIPIFGLYADRLNHVTLRMQTASGTTQTVLDLQTEPLPVDMPIYKIDRVDPTKYDPGLNFAFEASGLVVFDIDGNVRWYSTEKSYQAFAKLQNGRFMRTYSMGLEGNVMMEQDLLGKIYAVYYIADGIHHDVYELPNGNLLATTSDMRSGTTKDYLIEVDRKTGNIVRSFDFKDILDPGRPHQVSQLATNDWLHLNSITYDPSDHSIIVSSKGQSAVVKLSYPAMKIQWILGPHDNWSPKFQPYLLTPVGNNFEWQWSQHHATLYTPTVPSSQITDILLFDNGNYRSFTSPTAFPPSQWYSMVVHYRINEANKTVELVWEYGRELGSAIFSAARSGAYHLSNGDVLGTWGDIYKDAQGNPSDSNRAGGSSPARIIEVNPNNNDVVFQVSVPAEIYRTMRSDMYEGYSEVNVYLSTAVNDTSRHDLVNRGVLALRDMRRWTITPLVSALKTLVHQIRAALH